MPELVVLVQIPWASAYITLRYTHAHTVQAQQAGTGQ